MSIKNFFRKKPPVEEKSLSPEPEEMPEPNSVDDYMRRGWAYHSRDKNDQAEADFRKALELDPDSVDANYVLGLVLKAKEKDEEAIEAFKVAINLINNGKVENLNRAEMLRRLALGHVNEIKEGDWKLEEEFWRRER